MVLVCEVRNNGFTLSFGQEASILLTRSSCLNVIAVCHEGNNHYIKDLKVFEPLVVNEGA